MEGDDFVKNLRLECKICYEQYSDSVMPKMLHCSHSFCRNCIERLVKSAAESSSSLIRCPCCRKRNKFQAAKGVDSFKDNLDLRNVATTVMPTEVSSHDTSVLSTWSEGGHDAPALPALESANGDCDSRCPKHGAEINKYCKGCTAMICYECVLADHFEHAEAIADISVFAQKVKEDMRALLDLTSNLPYLRIRSAAARTRSLAAKRKDDLISEVDRTTESIAAGLQEDLEELDGAKQRLKQLGSGALAGNEVNSSPHDVQEARQSMKDVEGLLHDKGRRSPSGTGLEFIGMRPDGAIGDFIKDNINVIGNVANDQTITYVADNRKHNSVILVGTGHLGDPRVSKWMKSFRAEDEQSPVVFSSQIRSRGQERLLLVAVGHVIYKIDTSIGQCIADQIDTIHVKEGVILLEEASSITGIDWFPDEDKSLAILSLNTCKSLYLVDIETKALVKSVTTPVIPAIISSCRGEKTNLTIVRDNSSQSKLVVLNQHGKEEFRISPPKGITDYIPWVGCWVQATKPLRVAVVWCKSNRWKIMIHDNKSRPVKQLEEHADVAIPVSISYHSGQKYFVVCSKKGIQHYPSTL